MVDEYEREKLAFYTGHNGTTLGDLTSTFLAVPVAYCFAFTLKSCLLAYFHNSALKNTTFSKILWFFFDYAFHVIPLSIFLTALSDTIMIYHYVTTVAIFILFKMLPSTKPQQQKDDIASKQKTNKEENVNGKQSIITDGESFRQTCIDLTISSFQTMTYSLTTASILAVDFKIMPRKVAKTENYGISGMDYGVGLFVLCHAFKAVRRRFKTVTSDDSIYGEMDRFIINLWNAFKNSISLLIIGLLRVLMVKSTGYVEHASEYGIHWNFLFTLIVVKFVSCFFQMYVRKSCIRAALIAISFAASYQNLLSKQNYNQYLLRTWKKHEVANLSFVDANKEGIYSCLGYVAIYYFGEAIAIYVYSKVKEKTSNPFVPILKCVLFLFLFANVFYTLLQVSRHYIDNVSRRLCNISFIFSTLMFATLLLVTFLCTAVFITKALVQLNLKLKKSEAALKNFTFSFVYITDSKHIGLLIFVISNVLTGLVNLSINTIRVPNAIAYVIYFSYSLIVFSIAYVVFYKLNKPSKKTD